MTGHVEMTYGYPPISTRGTIVTIEVTNDIRALDPREMELIQLLASAAEDYLAAVSEIHRGEES